MIVRYLFLCFLLISLSVSAYAQQGAELGAFAGVSHYFGDLNTNYRVSDPNLAFGIVGRYNFNERIAVKLAGSIGKIEASDTDSNNTFERRRNLDFQSTISDVSAQIEFNFLPLFHGSKDQFFSPYLFAGLAVTRFNPQTAYCENSPSTPVEQCPGSIRIADLRPLGTEGQFQGEEYYTTSGALAFGAGLKVSLNYEWSINVELSARRMFTDYLDDVSGVYPDQNDLENFRGPLAVALSDRSLPTPEQIGETGRQRGNNQSKDALAFLTVGIVYYFGDLKCPKGSDSR